MSKSPRELKPWKTVASAIALETPWFRIKRQSMVTAKGVKLGYYIHEASDSVLCVCVNKSGKVLIEQQYRPSVGKVSTDYPAGSIEESDVSIEKAALRELKEETGCKPRILKHLATIDNDPSFSTAKLHIFLAQDIEQDTATPEETESISLSFVWPADILRLITSGTMSCTFCISASFFAFQELGWLKQFAPVSHPGTFRN